LKKELFSTRGYAEIHLQRPIFDCKEGIQKIVVLKIQAVGTCFGASSTYRIFKKKKELKSQFLVVFHCSSTLKLIVFGQILTEFGCFGLFWANLAAMAMVDSMPSFERKKINHHNFCLKCQNLACNGL
jgi:hypothetical protein